MSISQLPAEVLELVFQNLDGRTFSIAKQVSTVWLTVIKRLQKDKKLWQKFCLQEIDRTLLEDLLCFKNVPSCGHVINWIDVYQRWYQGHSISRKSYVVKKIPAFDSNPITSIKASGSWVITGHSSGCFCIWNKNDGELRKRFSCHLKAITDIALVDLLNLGFYCGPEDLLWSHHHMITVSKDTCIKVTSLLELDLIDQDNEYRCQIFYKHGDVISSLKVFNHQFAVASRDNTVTLWNMDAVKDPYFDLRVSFLCTIIGPPDLLQTLGYWHNQIYCISYAERLKVFEHDEWKERPYFKEFLTCRNNDSERKRWIITAYYTFHKQVMILFSACGQMIVSIGDGRSRIYPLFRTLQTSIVSLTLSGTTLAMGGENGKLYLFRVSGDQDLLNLDLSQPDFRELLSVASIVSVDVHYGRDTPVVVASTTESLFVVRWPKGRTR